MSNVFREIGERAKSRLADHLLLAGAMLADAAQSDLSGGGGFPAVKTGRLRNSVALSAYDPGEVAKDGYRIQVGIHKDAAYGAILMKKGWKMLPDTMDRIRAALMDVIEKGR